MPKSIYSYVMGSPLEDYEGEKILAYILIESANANQWQPFIINVPFLKDSDGIKTAKQYLDAVERIKKTDCCCYADKRIFFGLSVAKRGELVMPIEYKNNAIIIPSQKFLEFIIEKQQR
jgi:hypothetical protein